MKVPNKTQVFTPECPWLDKTGQAGDAGNRRVSNYEVGQYLMGIDE